MMWKKVLAVGAAAALLGVSAPVFAEQKCAPAALAADADEPVMYGFEAETMYMVDGVPCNLAVKGRFSVEGEKVLDENSADIIVLGEIRRCVSQSFFDAVSTLSIGLNEQNFADNTERIADVMKSRYYDVYAEQTKYILTDVVFDDWLFTGVTVEPPDEPYSLGDPNKDGRVDSKDASFVLAEYALRSTDAEAEPLPTEIMSAADVFADGMLDAKDASAILRYYAYVSTGGSLSVYDFLHLSGQ